MHSHPLADLDPFGPILLLTVLGNFWMTWVAEALCIVAVRRSRRRDGPAGERWWPFEEVALDASRFWVLPLYFWGLEASLRISESLFGPRGLVDSSPHHMLVFYEVFLALFLLVGCQSLAVFRADRPSLTLGLRGHRNLAATATLLAVWLAVSTVLLHS